MWLVQVSYTWIAMGWQAVILVVGLATIHRIAWWRTVPAVAVGTLIFVLFLVAIRDHVALII